MEKENIDYKVNYIDLGIGTILNIYYQDELVFSDVIKADTEEERLNETKIIISKFIKNHNASTN